MQPFYLVTDIATQIYRVIWLKVCKRFGVRGILIQPQDDTCYIRRNVGQE